MTSEIEPGTARTHLNAADRDSIVRTVRFPAVMHPPSRRQVILFPDWTRAMTWRAGRSPSVATDMVFSLSHR